MSNKLQISVIIPTFTRITPLYSCLASLAKQNIDPESFEIIIVNDNNKKFSEVKKQINYIVDQNSLQIIEKGHHGVAGARNLGVDAANANLLLFLSDDIIAETNLLQEHINFHKKNPSPSVAASGFVTWHPTLKVGLFEKWLYKSGALADYNNLKNKQKLSFSQIYTSNASIKKDFILKFGKFDSDFKYSYEDTELFYRLADKGLKIIYLKNAKAYHDHPISLNEFLEKMKQAGKAGKLFYKKHPETIGKIFPVSLPWQERLRLEFWHCLYPAGKILNSRKILFNNYQRLTNKALISGFKS